MIFTAPDDITNVRFMSQTKVFLAGSIEQGTAENWQDVVAKRLADGGCVVLNPRRADWDASWEQRFSNPDFRLQVTWEQCAILMADFVVFYFDSKTKSPITLLELGQVLQMDKKCIVYCDPEFWRYGNIEVMCHLYGVKLEPCMNITKI